MAGRRFIFIAALCVLLLSGGLVWAQDEEEASPFTLNGFLQMQGGIFTSFYENKHDDEGFPKEHGGHWGQPSMFRNTLQLEATWTPIGQVTLYTLFRGVRSSSLLADNFAQVPDMYADTNFNYDPADQREKRNRVADRYYQEADFRELYLDIYPTDWWSWRVGRQQVAWGESANARLLDVINPIDSTWHLGVFEDYEDQRVPLWTAKTLFDIAAINASIEAVFIPLIDDPEDTVNVPLTFVGAWGLPVASKNDYVSSLRIVNKKCLYPDKNLENTRWGVRWKEFFGPFTYTLVYYHGHQLTPPVPKYVEQNKATNEEGYNEAEVFLEFPRQDTYGASMELNTPRPISTVIRFEGTYLPDALYPVSSHLRPGKAPDGGDGWKDSPDRLGWQRAFFHQEERDTYNWGVSLLRANQIRFLNPTSSIIVQAQVIQTIIPGGPYIDEELNGEKKENKNFYIVDIPGYDSSKSSEFSTLYAGGLMTSYAHGLISPKFVGIYAENSKSWLVSSSFDFAIGDYWRIRLAYNAIEGEDPYKGLGLFRDRDEVNMRIRYQF